MKKFSRVVFVSFYSNRRKEKIMSSRLGLIPTCGLALLSSPKETFDFVLKVTDGKQAAKVPCHRCVLVAHSLKLRDFITCENYFELTIKLLPGYIPALLELVQYMYLKDHTLITDIQKVLELCGTLHMKLDHFIVSRGKTEKLNQYPVVYHIHLQENTAAVLPEFTRLVEFQNVQIAPPPKIKSEEEEHMKIATKKNKKRKIEKKTVKITRSKRRY